MNVSVEASAKAELSLQAEIPKKSMGRLVDALTDMLRPFSEDRGLRADQIRLQREDVAIEIAKKARVRLEIEGAPIGPVENKILLPLIEKSSIEDISDTAMLDRWSVLLANAATSDHVQPRYIQILSELTSRQANLFEKIMLNENKYFPNPEQYFLDSGDAYSSPRIRDAIHSTLLDKKKIIDIESFFNEIFGMLDRPGCVIFDVVIFRKENEMYSMNIGDCYIERDENFELDLEILESLGLTRKVSIFTKTKFHEDIQLFYYHATELGVRFFSTVDRREGRLTKLSDGLDV